MEPTVDALLAEIPAFVQTIVCGGEFPRGDPAGMRRAAAAWRERSGQFEELCRGLEASAEGLRAVTSASSSVGSTVVDAGDRFVVQLRQASHFCIAKAAQLEDNALIVEKIQWEMGLLLVAVSYQLLCSGGWGGAGGFAVAARARQSFLVLLEKLIGAVEAQAARSAGMRVGLSAVQALGLGVAQAGVDLGVQLAQREHRAGIDGESVRAAAVMGVGAGAGAVVGREIARGMISGTTGVGRGVVGAVAGVAGLLGAVWAASLTNRETGGCGAEIIGGAAMGVLAGRMGVGRSAEPVGDGRSESPTVRRAEPLSAPSIEGGPAQLLASMAEREASGMLWRLDVVELVGPTVGRGGDGVSVSGPGGHSSRGLDREAPPRGSGSSCQPQSGSSRFAAGSTEVSIAGSASGGHAMPGTASKSVGGINRMPTAAVSTTVPAHMSVSHPRDGDLVENASSPRTEIAVGRPHLLVEPVRILEFDHPVRPAAASDDAPAIRSPQHVFPPVLADDIAPSSTTSAGTPRLHVPLAVGSGTALWPVPEPSGAQNDPTLTRPVLDPDEGRPGTIAPPGRLIDPTEISQFGRALPAVPGILPEPPDSMSAQPMTAADEPTSDPQDSPSTARDAVAESGGNPMDSADGGHGVDDIAARTESSVRPISPEEDRFKRWYLTRAAAIESGLVAQSVSQYARMHHLDELQIRRWLDSAGIAAEAPLATPATPVPEPRSDLVHEWLRDMRSYLALTPEQMEELTDAEAGSWPALESPPSHTAPYSSQSLLCTTVRALLRRVPDARLLYQASMQRFGLDHGSQPKVGDILRMLRESRGWTIAQLSDVLDESAAKTRLRESARGLREGWENHLAVIAVGSTIADPTRITAGSSLQLLREQLDVTHEQLAQRMAVKPSRVNEIETGTTELSLPTIALYVEAVAPGGDTGALLRSLREQRGLSIRETARAMRLDGPTLLARENTGVLPTVRAWKTHLRVLIDRPQEIADRDLHLGTYLRRLRERADLSIEQVAERASPTADTVRNIENAEPPAAEPVMAYLDALAPRAPLWPEGHSNTGSYIRTLCEEAGLTTRGLANVANLTYDRVDEMVKGRTVRPRPDGVAACFHVLPHGSATWRELTETFDHLPREELVFPSPYATESLYEYVQYFERLNRISKVRSDEMFGLRLRDATPLRSGVLTALRAYDNFLHESGISWNDFGRAWNYNYWMDPAGESIPLPVNYSHIREWLRSLRLFRRDSVDDFSARTGSPEWLISAFEKGRTKPSMKALRILRDRCSLPDEIARSARERFYPTIEDRDPDPETHALFWEYFDARVGSGIEFEKRREIAAKYDWVPSFIARKISVESDGLMQYLREALIKTIGNHLPGNPFLPHVFATSRWASYAYWRQERYAHVPQEIRGLVIDVDRYLNTYYQETAAKPRKEEISLALELTPHQVEEALFWRRVNVGSLSANAQGSEFAGLDVERTVADDTPQPPIEDDPDLRAEIRKAVADLPDPDSVTELVELTHVRGYTPTEAAERLQLPAAEAERLLEHAAQRLRAAFSDRAERRQGRPGTT
ncbi:helix-turn-helix domain-containing protein [Nocardia brasiliensis]|uniref:helix-turn-helix domain-containing protein n=1 Tax=Nocardia brasiliensis TaxID=37326 RepID=UPI002454843E|nr:helix-turn-helix domain-containing protein [Nocardia brasiliensis]